MRICYVAADVAVPYFRGSSTHVYELARNLVKLGHEVHVVARRVNASQPKVENLDGMVVHRYQRGVLFSPKRSSFSDTQARGSYRGDTSPLIWKSYEAYLRTVFPLYIAVEVTRLVREYSIDLIFERETSFGAGAMASALTGRPFILEVIGNRVTGLQLSRSEKIIAYSKGMFEGTAEASKVVIVTGAVDTDEFRPDPAAGEEVRKQYPIGDSPVVGYVGTFQEWHGMSELIAAAQNLLHARGDIKFLMAGPYYKETQERVAAAGISDSFVFTGPVQYREVPKFMNASDVLVAPYNPERIESNEQVRKHGLGSPLKVFEYMSVGKPVVTTDVKPISDPIENGVTGYLVPPGDSDALATAVLGLLQDGVKAKRMGLAARQSVISNYSWSIVAQQLGEIFQDVMHPHATGQELVVVGDSK
jgi:glycosyltransferase involved in cell wall biosynthesis